VVGQVPGTEHFRNFKRHKDAAQPTASPRVSVLQMEGGIAGFAAASGMAAMTTSLLTIAGIGDNIVSISQLPSALTLSRSRP
jgi:O-acetylhomoserine/O-acetylserine sulfhydrylase-like pyridoxal-dependent enzyme